MSAGRSSGRGSVSWTATLGLVVHAAADGIALGAAATTNQTDVEMIVFLAIMLHKVSTVNITMFYTAFVIRTKQIYRFCHHDITTKQLLSSGPGQLRAGDLPPARGHGPRQGQEAPARVLPLRPMRRHRHLPAAAVQVS